MRRAADVKRAAAKERREINTDHQGTFSTNSSRCFFNEKLTKSSRRFLYDAEIVAGSPLRFEKYPQDFFFRELAPCKNESRPNDHFQQGAASIRSKQWM